MEVESATRVAESLDSVAAEGRFADRMGEDGIGGRLIQGLARGAIASMTMTGFREVTRHAGLLEEPPPFLPA